MKQFLDDNFLLQTGTAERLYHDYAAHLPIIDYHNHLPPDEIIGNRIFENITQAWLAGDHYKWRAMRANGVPEKYCTGDTPDREKFQQWAATVPHTMRNPLYHWTHLELRRYFNIDKLLNEESADAIYQETSAQLSDRGAVDLLTHMKVELVCTTDDPVDSLEHHLAWSGGKRPLKLIPAFRADKVLFTDDPDGYNQYLDTLSEVSGIEISTYDGLLEALRQRHDFFHQAGCRLSDNGLEQLFAEEFTQEEIHKTFTALRGGRSVTPLSSSQYKTAVLLELARMNHEKGWTQQYHLGALRNNSTRMLQNLGRDTGFDSIGDLPQAYALSRFFDRLDRTDQLAKTIIYNLNPSDNAVFATMASNFNDGTVAGKMQFGSGWWFLDQKDGIEQQINVLSNMGLLSKFVGMLTDSRSFLSFPRHEYFRRVLCNILGNDVENGELPHDLEWLGKMISDISYYNAKSYFNFTQSD